MRLLFLFLASFTFIHAIVLPILPLNSTDADQHATTSIENLASFRGHCVDDSRFPGWHGAINNNDCSVAQKDLELQTRHILRKQLTFWSNLYTPTPPSNGWRLPIVARYKTCTILLRITKDFGNDTVPFYQGGYLPTQRLPTTVRSSWENVLGAIAAVRQQCLQARGQPGWADIAGSGGAKAAIALTLPADSEMARDWTLDLEGDKRVVVDEIGIS